LSKKIVVNTRVLRKPNMGIKRYVEELMRRFGDEVDSISPGAPLQGIKAHLWEQFILPTRLEGRLLWSPIGLGPLAVKNQVLTVQDVSFLDHPEWYSGKFAAWYGWLTPQIARRVTHVITSSNFSKQRLVKNAGIAEEKVTVIPLGVDTREFYPRSAAEIEAIRNSLQIPSSRYVLSFGTLEPRKNLPRLIEAWRRIQQSDASTDIWLVIAGAKGKSAVFQEVDFPNLPPRICLTGYVADDHLPALYSGAIALAYLSLYEGFGLPPLESMAAGTPPLTGNLTSIPEVVGVAGLMVDPYNVDEIAEGLLRLMRDGALREDLRIKGLDRAKRFTWDLCARNTFDVLETAARKSS
jgi:glycosyltransferase involved in cell wall biosynthesis